MIFDNGSVAEAVSVDDAKDLLIPTLKKLLDDSSTQLEIVHNVLTAAKVAAEKGVWLITQVFSLVNPRLEHLHLMILSFFMNFCEIFMLFHFMLCTLFPALLCPIAESLKPLMLDTEMKESIQPFQSSDDKNIKVAAKAFLDSLGKG